MTLARQALGKLGEETALNFLEKIGLTLFQKNYRVRTGEIDLVMWHEEILVFVEVRARADEKFGTPIETITSAKRRKIVMTARHFLREKKISDEVRCRFDLVGIVVGRDEEIKVEYVENAFFVGE